MYEDKKEFVQARKALQGIRGHVLEHKDLGRNCHYNVGQSLNLIYDTLLGLLPDEDQKFFKDHAPRLEFPIPSSADSGVYTVISSRAWLLINQLETEFPDFEATLLLKVKKNPVLTSRKIANSFLFMDMITR